MPNRKEEKYTLHQGYSAGGPGVSVELPKPMTQAFISLKYKKFWNIQAFKLLRHTVSGLKEHIPIL